MGLDGFAASLAVGLGITLAISGVAFLLATLIGAVTTWARLAGSGVGRTIAGAYSVGARAVPDYVLMLLVYFGGQLLLTEISRALGVNDAEIPPAVAATLALALVFGSYMGEAIRGAWIAIPRAQLDAATAAGIGVVRRLRRIALPQLVVHGFAAFINVWLVLLKATAVASLIGVNDLIRRTQAAAAVTQEPLKFYGAVSAAFLLLTLASDHGARWLLGRAHRSP